MGKYISEGGLHPEQQAPFCSYLDVMGCLWDTIISLERLTELEQKIPVLLAQLKAVLPSWELDLNRHLMLHLVDANRINGPMGHQCRTWSMFGPGRVWNRLVK